MDTFGNVSLNSAESFVQMSTVRSLITFRCFKKSEDLVSYIFPPEGFVVAICFIMLISQLGTVLSWRGRVAIGKVNTTIELSSEGERERGREEQGEPGCQLGDKVRLWWSIDFNTNGDLDRFIVSFCIYAL